MPRDPSTTSTIRSVGRVGVYPPGEPAFSVPVGPPTLLDFILAARVAGAETAAAARDAVAAALAESFGVARPADLDGEDFAMFVHTAAIGPAPAAAFGAFHARYRAMTPRGAASPA